MQQTVLPSNITSCPFCHAWRISEHTLEKNTIDKAILVTLLGSKYLHRRHFWRLSSLILVSWRVSFEIFMDVNSNKTTRSALQNQNNAPDPYKSYRQLNSKVKVCPIGFNVFPAAKLQGQIAFSLFHTLCQGISCLTSYHSPLETGLPKRKSGLPITFFCERPIWNFRICTTSYHHFIAPCFFCVCPRVPHFLHRNLRFQSPWKTGPIKSTSPVPQWIFSTWGLFVGTPGRVSKLPTPRGENRFVGRCSPQVVWGGSFISRPKKWLKSPPILLLGL